MASYRSSELSELDRKALRKPDGFITTVSLFFSSLLEHFRGLTIIVSTLLVIGVGLALWVNQRDNQTHQADNALFFAEKSMARETKALMKEEADLALPSGKKVEKSGTKAKEDSAAKAQNTQESQSQDSQEALENENQVEFKKLDVEAKFPETIQKLKALEEQFPGSRAAFEARLRLGGLYFHHGDFEKGVIWYEKAVASMEGGLGGLFRRYFLQNFEKAVALSLLGNAYESAGNPEKSIESYQKALRLGEGSLKGDLLLGLARNYQILHDSAKARGIYDQILAELPNTDYSKSAEIFIDTLTEGTPEGSGGAPGTPSEQLKKSN